MKSHALEPEQNHLLVLDPNDEAIEVLTAFARQKNIRAASFQAIGAFREVTYAYWNADTKKYENLDVREQVEVIALTGNIAVTEKDETRIHSHVVIGRRDGSTGGGHLISGRVYPTLEIFLIQYAATLLRRREHETGLALLAL